MFAGIYSTSAASVSASVASAPPRGRVATVEPQRTHSALMPGASSSTRWASPQLSQARTVSLEAIRPPLAIYVPAVEFRPHPRGPHETTCRPPLRVASNRLRLQQAAVYRRASEGRLGRGGEPVPAAGRSDSQPGEHREGLRAAGAAGAD